MKLDSTGSFLMENDKAVEASFKIALLIAKDKKPHTIGEPLIKPCLITACSVILSEDSSANDLPWEKVIGMCTDGAQAMTGRRSGFIELAKKKNSKIIGSHCIIHRRALACQTLPESLNVALNIKMSFDSNSFEGNNYDLLFVGIEGDSSYSALMLFNYEGDEVIKINGPSLNQWGLCLSGCDSDKICREMKHGLLRKYPAITDNYFICHRLIGILTSSIYDAGIVLDVTTGTHSLLMNLSGSTYRTGGWGHILGDEGSTFWIAMKAMKIIINDQENIEKPPHGFSTAYIWNAIQKQYSIEKRSDLLPLVYRQFDKSYIAALYHHIVAGVKHEDKLSAWILEDAGRCLGRLLLSHSSKIEKELLENKDGFPVICSGLVWENWEMIKYGFVGELHSAPTIKELQLMKITATVAHGAVLLAARSVNIDLKNILPDECTVFYHYKRDAVLKHNETE
ncbi:N-acetyl-D-glucosamine kinase-like [Lycorma delicatula]|uniref:N-acetyl-D-glucosamine kinase-like n=1 Tax=Lycorma delicatula TaxID=130591 RepID=UPI003F513A77